MERRKVTFKLYPNATQVERLTVWTRLHCELYNAALEERISAYQKHRKSISYYDQQNVLPEIKASRPEFVELGSHALQQTLWKLDLAFQAFFRRVKAGQTPGFPRFKASKRFSGFCYPDPAGWKLTQNGSRGATIRLGSGKDAMSIRARGRHRFGEGAKTNDLTITRKNGEWFASVTLRVSEDACARARAGDAHRGVDFGLKDWATFDNGETIANPRFVRNEMPRMAELQRQKARKKRGSIRYRRLGRRVAKVHERIGNLRREFLHKTTSRMVGSCAVIATEELRTQNMSRSAKGTHEKPGRMVKQKAGLNREILSAGLSMAHNMLAYKAVEAGTQLHVSNTRQLKPSQRCAACWELVPKTLAQRMHVCTHCGHTAHRDQNAASVVLIDAHTPGTGVAARLKPLARQRAKSRSVTRETPATATTDA
ncbi:RNA-guided endonuclease InsQ/TnpB family protein [Paraburkholderia phenoliruptrix]|uniref:RNA-guided endonuclease InsQ/TnpB family protein n=1 Tax=Paraburkholderia phenoliruptrix TaxID=252970 RepID=UPI002869BEE5|nr:transposase [Paraburkholderia phenoliruptrix]WMY11114.1 transposase [Paraburkholderia phenoliruptrix]